MIVIIHQGRILQNLAFQTIQQAKNFVAMNFKRRWKDYTNHQSQIKQLLEKNGASDLMECANHGTRFYFVDVEPQQHEA